LQAAPAIHSFIFVSEVIMKSKIHMLQIVLFLALIIAPTLLYPILRPQINDINIENRVLDRKPVLSFSILLQYPTAFDHYFDDNLPFKYQFLSLNSHINYCLFYIVSSNQIVMGKDGWLFYGNVNDSNPVATYKGIDYFTEEELLAIAQNLIQTRDCLREKGIEFALFIAPDKEIAYATFMPDQIKWVNAITRVDILVDYLHEHTDINVVHPKQEIRKAKKNAPPYYMLDTHWNNFGAFIGAKALLQA